MSQNEKQPSPDRLVIVQVTKTVPEVAAVVVGLSELLIFQREQYDSMNPAVYELYGVWLPIARAECPDDLPDDLLIFYPF